MSVSDASIGNGLSQGDSLYLINPSGDTVDRVGGFPKTGDGVSAERRAPWKGEVLPSRSPSGHSLGMGNSVSCEYDITISAEGVGLSNGGVRATFLVKNTGIREADFPLEVVWNGSVHRRLNVQLDSDSQKVLYFEFPSNVEGTNEFGLLLEGYDCDSSGVEAYLHHVIGRPTLVINEFTYKGTEWVELHNAGDWDLHLRDAGLGDASSFSSPFNAQLPAGGFAVLTGDSTFRNLFPDVPFIFIEDVPKLNNSSDSVKLVEKGVVLDALYYRSSWGGDINVSLERISPFMPSSDSNNWGTTRDPRGGTPGRPNSLTLSPPESGVSIGKEVFNRSEPVPIAFSYNFRVEVIKVILYDDLGRKVMEKEFRPRARMGQILFTPDHPHRGLYFLFVEVKGGGKVERRKFRVAFR